MNSDDSIPMGHGQLITFDYMRDVIKLLFVLHSWLTQQSEYNCIEIEHKKDSDEESTGSSH